MTHYDFHRTFVDLIGGHLDELDSTSKRKSGLFEDERIRAQSLFLPANNRNCETMDIPEQFCICLDEIADRAALHNSVLHAIVTAVRQHCARAVISETRAFGANKLVRNSVRHFDNATIAKLANLTDTADSYHLRFYLVLAHIDDQKVVLTLQYTPSSHSAEVTCTSNASIECMRTLRECP